MQAIVAVDRKNGIGKGGQLLFPIPDDLKHFKKLTMGHPILYGRKTMETFPSGRPLRGRQNIVLTKGTSITIDGVEYEEKSPRLAEMGVQLVHTVEEALSVCPSDTFVIGGASVYQQVLPFCDEVYLTQIEADGEADAFFPALSPNEWATESYNGPFSYNGLKYAFVTKGRL